MNELMAEPPPRPGHSCLTGDQCAEIQITLERQTESLQILAEGFQQFQKQIAADVVEAIRNSDVRTNRVLSGSEAEDQSVSTKQAAVEQSTKPDPEEPMDSVNASWAMIRQAMLDSVSDESSTSAADDGDENVVTEEIVSEEAVAVEREDLTEPFEPLLFDVPEPYNADTIEDDALRTEFLAREEIMRLLSIRLRQQVQPVSTISTEQLREMAESLPDDLRERIERSLGQLDEQLRLTELELSLERAKMARTIVSMDETQRTIESMARQMGYHIKEDGTLESTANSVEPGRRWLRVLGFGR